MPEFIFTLFSFTGAGNTNASYKETNPVHTPQVKKGEQVSSLLL